MDIQSAGNAAAVYQRPPREILAGIHVAQAERACAEGRPAPREAEPELRLNGLAYFLESDVERAIVWLAERDAERARQEASRDE